MKCACGCGGEVIEKPWHKYPKYIAKFGPDRFIGGHNNRGNKASDEARKNMSEAGKNKKFTQKHKQNISKAKKGQKPAPQTIAASVAARKGKKLSTEHIIKIQESRAGYTHTEETKRKIARSNTGKIHSKATRKKLAQYTGEKNSRWNGSDDWWHREAWKNFGKAHCEICGCDLEDHMIQSGKRFDMHNCLEPKDYTVMKPEAWMTLCGYASKNQCHRKIED